jgi:MGT family glycosyltransferase
MTAVLAYTSPAMGHLYPMMPLLLELRDRGLDVHVRTLDTLVDQARAAGLSAERIDARLRPIADKHPDWAATNAKAALERSATMFAERAVLDGPDFRRAIEEVDPDLLIVDTNAWGALVVAEAQHRPWLHFSPYLVPLRSAGTPPFGPGLPRWDNPVGRVRDAVVGRLVFGAVERSIIPRINALRTPAGLAPVRSFDDLVLAAPLVAICSATPFDYPHPDWPSHVISIGAMTWEPPTAPPAWLADLPDPLTLVTTSSEYQADEALARVAVAALASEPGSLVVTMPAGVPDDLRDLPPNVRVEQFVPHAPLVARAAVAVTHGGMGATQKALAGGIPVCVVPYGRDQLETAARVVHADAGTQLAPKKLTPAALRAAVRAAAGKRAGAAACADGFRAAGGARAAADALLAQLASPSRR